MTDAVMGEVVDFPARAAVLGDDADDLLTGPGPSADGAGDDGPRGPRLPAVPVPDDDGDDEQDDDTDRESVAADRVLVGVPVDPPDEYRARRAAGADRAPVIPPGLASRRAVAGSVAWAVREARYHAGFHAVRAPKYAVKTALFAPVGAVRTAGRLARWASAEDGNWHLRQAAAGRGDHDAWLKLDARRQRQSRWRWPLVVTGAVLALLALLVLAIGPVPAVVRLAGLAVVLVVLARLGRPADRPITDRVRQGATYRKLTAELVRRALLSLQLAGINSAVARDPGAISFPVEIHRDGPGHLAVLARVVFTVFLLTFIAARLLVILIMGRMVPDLFLHMGQDPCASSQLRHFSALHRHGHSAFLPRERPGTLVVRSGLRLQPRPHVRRIRYVASPRRRLLAACEL